MMLLRALVLLVTASVAVVGCSTKTCTTAGCSDLVSARLALGRPANELRGGTVRFCVDGECTTSMIDDADAAASALQCAGGRVQCLIGPTTNDLDVSFERRAGVAKMGEVVEVTVLAPTGETVTSRKGTVDYVRTEPNGPECEPTCLHGELK